MTSLAFETRSNEAYRHVGAHPPGQGWFAFDVLMPAARRGEAKLFAMTVWNSGIRMDIATGSYWYRVPRTIKESHPGHRTALWNGMSIAQEFSLPKLAILKDRETARCSIHHIFHIVDVRYEEDGSAFWLRLDTRGGSIGADAQRIDLSYLSGLPIQDSSSKEFSRNAIWSRDELILALDLYIRHRGTSLAKDAPVIEELSQVLNELGIMLGTSNSRTYRNTNGVYMKLMNFRRLDPDYTASGRSGLTRGNSDEVRVWKLFAHDPVHLAEVAEFIRNGVLGYSKDVGIAERDESEIEEAEEGRVATRIHRYRERDPRLVKEAKARALKRHGRLVCAACNFDFSQSYGITGKGIIDVHHTKPVHTMRPGEKTKVADLVLLCSNCHRVVHSRRQWLTVAQIKSALCV